MGGVLSITEGSVVGSGSGVLVAIAETDAKCACSYISLAWYMVSCSWLVAS